jgi:hypothetical protein
MNRFSRPRFSVLRIPTRDRAEEWAAPSPFRAARGPRPTLRNREGNRHRAASAMADCPAIVGPVWHVGPAEARQPLRLGEASVHPFEKRFE